MNRLAESARSRESGVRVRRAGVGRPSPPLAPSPAPGPPGALNIAPAATLTPWDCPLASSAMLT